MQLIAGRLNKRQTLRRLHPLTGRAATTRCYLLQREGARETARKPPLELFEGALRARAARGAGTGDSLSQRGGCDRPPRPARPRMCRPPSNRGPVASDGRHVKTQTL